MLASAIGTLSRTWRALIGGAGGASATGPFSPPDTVTTFYLLLETGDRILMETSGSIALE